MTTIELTHKDPLNEFAQNVVHLHIFRDITRKIDKYILNSFTVVSDYRMDQTAVATGYFLDCYHQFGFNLLRGRI